MTVAEVSRTMSPLPDEKQGLHSAKTGEKYHRQTDASQSRFPLMTHSTQADNAYVIIVDDDPLILSLLVCLIEKNGLIARGFTCPAEALQAIGSQTVCPDLLISDYDMGPINGLSLIEKSRNHFPDLACILISANDAVGSSFLPRNTHFIAKPFRARALWSVVQDMLAAR